MQKVYMQASICRKILLLLMFILYSGVQQSMSLILSAAIKMLRLFPQVFDLFIIVA